MSPDADLILLCDAYMRALDVYNGKALWLGADGAPVAMTQADLEAVVKEIEGALDGRQATTLLGLAAKCRVVMHQANQPGGMDFGEGVVGDWPEQVVRDLLRIMDGAA